VVDTGVFAWLPSGGTKVVFDDNLMTSTADLEVLSPAGDQVVYSWNVDLGSTAGIYVTAVP